MIGVSEGEESGEKGGGEEDSGGDHVGYHFMRSDYLSS